MVPVYQLLRQYRSQFLEEEPDWGWWPRFINVRGMNKPSYASYSLIDKLYHPVCIIYGYNITFNEISLHSELVITLIISMKIVTSSSFWVGETYQQRD